MTEQTRFSLRRAPDRRKVADLIAAELRKVKGAEVTILAEGEDFGPRRRSVAAVVDGVRVFMDLNGALPDFIMAHWHFTDRQGRLFSARFPLMLGGAAPGRNLTAHHKATGPMVSANRLGFDNERDEFDLADLEQFAVTLWRALQDVADGGCIERAAA